MKKTYGQQPTAAPEGTYREIHFPEIMALDTETIEGILARHFQSVGAGVRELPVTIYYMDRQSEGAHVGSVAAGALHEVTIDPESKKASGKGWVMDNADGRAMALGVLSGAVRRNSADLGDVPAGGMTINEIGQYGAPDFKLLVDFNRFNIIGTTVLGKSGFATSHAEIPADIAAAMDSNEPLICDAPSFPSAHSDVEIMAAMSTRPSWDHFNRLEPDLPCPIVVDEPDKDGWIPIYGNVAQWRKQHRDAAGVLRHPPRGYDNYMNFMKPKAVLTDQGWVPAGPITLLGGHVSLREAANNIENVWADVRVIDGKHGPWMCGVMRPHIAADEIEVYRARASQISGYWSGGVMRLICSVTAAGYPITESEDQDALVAGFNPDSDGFIAFPLQDMLSVNELSSDARARLQAWLDSGSRGEALPVVEEPQDRAPEVAADPFDDSDDLATFAFRQRQRERELALEVEAV